ncbi:hypothetical protein EES45_23045 [Streptomyces sp. ADI97-07]|uniref:hypothetical protein n=1 Tax=Streptomyces sp. ADI97-07 TaxID=1522762 RepID=UPI000F54CEB7|nr:hypothetical protein [Streptomyces sp. ADI97-07]RPK76371.1 hypothetical protein EES45_23045 [Streptomyces sp. ADI97-07]
MSDRIRDPHDSTPTGSTGRRVIAVGATTHRGGRTITMLATPDGMTGIITPSRTAGCDLAPSGNARAALDTIAGCLIAERPAYAMTEHDRRWLARIYAATEFGVGELDGAGETLLRELLHHMPPVTDRFENRRAYGDELRAIVRP